MAPNKPISALRKTLYQGKALNNLWKFLQTKTAKCIYVVLAAALVLIVLFSLAITPERYHLQVGDIAYKTITASKDVVDETATARQREEAARLVEPTYLHKEGVAAEVLQNLSAILIQVNAVQQYGLSTLEQNAPGDAKAQRAYVFSTAELEYASSLVPLRYPFPPISWIRCCGRRTTK